MRTGVIPRHVTDPAGYTRVVLRCMYSAVVAGLNAVRRSSRDAECKAQCSNGQGQAPMLHFGFSLFGVVSSSWRSPRRHCPVQRTPSCSRSWGTSISTLHAGRWSPCVQTSSRISRNDIGRSAWAQTQQMSAGGRECTVYGWWLI
jgi:hypothetical protein